MIVLIFPYIIVVIIIVQQMSASDSWSRSKSISNRSELRAEYLDCLEQRQLRGMVTFIRTFLQPA